MCVFPRVWTGVQSVTGRKPRPHAHSPAPGLALRAEVAGQRSPHAQGRADASPRVGLAAPAAPGPPRHNAAFVSRLHCGWIPPRRRKKRVFRDGGGEITLLYSLSGNCGLTLPALRLLYCPHKPRLRGRRVRGWGERCCVCPLQTRVQRYGCSRLRVPPPSPRESPGSQTGAPKLSERNGPSYLNRP